MFCRRCYVYDCHIHGTEQPLAQFRLVDPKSVKDPNCVTDPNNKCGPECYNNKKRDNKKDSNGKLMEWEDDEKAILRRAIDAFESDWCQIAKLLGPRSCSECYDMGQSDPIKPVDSKKRQRLSSRPRPLQSVINSKIFRDTIKQREQRGGQPSAHYRPCSHEGPCATENCVCHRGANFCEKYCGCDIDCKRRFPGCHCKLSQCQTRACPCFAANRECDLDLCQCGAGSNNEVTMKCKNVGIQRGDFIE